MEFTRFKEQNCRISSPFPVFHEEEEEEEATPAPLTSRVFPLIVVKQDPTTRDGGGEKSKVEFLKKGQK